MTIRNRTPRVVPQWMSIAEVARKLEINQTTALRRLKAGSIPGLERMYPWDDGRTHWHVLRSAFEAWRASQKPALAS